MTPMILTFHLLLFGVKLWAVVMFANKFKNYPWMFTWSMIYLFAETWYLHKFFIDIDLGVYEIVSVIDQGIFTIGLVFYLVKEVEQMAKGRTNGGNRGGGKNGGKCGGK